MTIKYVSPVQTYIHFDQEDKIWWMSDGYKIVPRASLNVSKNCPKEYQDILTMAIARGYIYPTACMTEKEYVWATLEK